MRTFKTHCRQPPGRSATPPRPAYELIAPAASPVLRPSENTSGAPPAEEQELALGNAAMPFSPPARGLETAQGEQPPPPPPPPQPAYPPASRLVPSPIDALANAAVSTPYNDSHRRPSQPPISPRTTAAPFPRPQKHAYPDAASHYAEAPSKRVRADLFQRSHHHYARPVARHTTAWAYNEEHIAYNARLPYPSGAPSPYAHSSPAKRRSEAELAEAQLLVDFAAAINTPSPRRPHAATPRRWSVSRRDLLDAYQGRPVYEPGPMQLPVPYSPAHPHGRAPSPHFEQHASAAVPPYDSAPPPPFRNAAAQTHTPPEDPLGAASLQIAEPPSNGEERKPKKPKNGSKSKPRGGPVTEKKKKSAPRPADVVPPASRPPAPEQLQSPQSLPTDVHDDVPKETPAAAEPLAQTPRSFAPHSRRLSESGMQKPETADTHAFTNSSRAQSVPVNNAMSITPSAEEPDPVSQAQPLEPLRIAPENRTDIPTNNLPAKKSDEQTSVTICAGCNSTDSATSVGDGEQWINCDGCKGWFHYTCAGFKSEREVRLIDKFYCKECRPKFGNTTKLRKSNRTHTAVDYAGLNEGIMKTSDDNPEHHYVTAIKNGDIEFTPETFARLPPEFVTADFVEKMNGFNEPVVIPAALNPRPKYPHLDAAPVPPKPDVREQDASEEQCPYGIVPDDGQDKLDMVIPEGLTVRRVAEIYGMAERVPVIDVKTQDGLEQWNMAKWADYYEQEGEKPVRNVISLEVSRSKLGKLLRRPKMVRDMDLQDWVWREDDKYLSPAVQFYCLMSVADSYTDFHIDFGGSSVYYHIVKGRKTFLFIRPTKQNLKKYEEWCLSPQQSQEFLGHQVNECYRIDLYPGDTMMIPSGWIHAVWTPTDSLVIGGNYLTRIHYGMQIRVLEIEKATGVALKYRYPFFQKIMWLAVIKYLEEDPLPATVEDLLLGDGTFPRSTPIYCEPDKFGHNSDIGPENYNKRYYSKGEVEGLSDLVTYIWRSVMVSLGKIEGITQQTRNNVTKSIPKGHGEPSLLARRFAMWVAWKKGNEKIPAWALPDPSLAGAVQGKKAERESWSETIKPVRGGERHSSLRARVSEQPPNGEARVQTLQPVTGFLRPHREHVTTPKTSQLGPKRIACDACRKRRIRCKHKDELVESPQSAGSGNGHMPHIPTSSSPPTMGPVEVTLRRASETDVPSATFAFPSQFDMQSAINGGPISGDLAGDPLTSKSGRVKACADCRKSKRRCVHDEHGNVDPVKAAEAPVPRGQAAKKRRGEDNDDGEALTKKLKLESFAGLVDGEVSHWNRYPLQKSRPSLSETTSREKISDESPDYQAQREDSNIDPQLLDALERGEAEPQHAGLAETIVTSIERDGPGEPEPEPEPEPMEGVEATAQAVEQAPPPPVDNAVRHQTPEPQPDQPPRTPVPIAQSTAQSLYGAATVPVPANGVGAGAGPSAVSPSSPSSVRSAHPHVRAEAASPTTMTPNWSRSSLVSSSNAHGHSHDKRVPSTPAIGSEKSGETSVGRSGPGSASGKKAAVLATPVTSPSGKGRLGRGDRAGSGSAQKSRARSRALSMSGKKETGKGKERVDKGGKEGVGEDEASLALALQLQMEEHGLRRRSK